MARPNYENRKRVNGENDADTGSTLDILASICRKQGKLKEAETLGLRSYDILKSAYGAKHSQTMKSAQEMVKLYARMGRQDEKEEWLPRTSK